MIPKVIHYCWFGRNPKPAIIKKCIKSWKKFCPDYDIIEWNEDNFDVYSNQFCENAYKTKKWAFVSDYARLKILYDNGGIYMDTDVELLKPIDFLMNHECFLGFQHENYVNNGLITGTIPKHSFIKENLLAYENEDFCNHEDSRKLKVCQEYTTEILVNYGLRIPCDNQLQIVNNVYVYPPEFFSPFDHRTQKTHLTHNTTAIHHYASSWWDAKRRREYNKNKRSQKVHAITHVPNRILMNVLGKARYENIKKLLKRS